MPDHRTEIAADHEQTARWRLHGATGSGLHLPGMAINLQWSMSRCEADAWLSSAQARAIGKALIAHADAFDAEFPEQQVVADEEAVF